MLPLPSQCWLVIVSTVSGLSFQFRLQIATLNVRKGDKPYKIMTARFILQEIVVFQNKQETWLLETAQICIKTFRFWISRWPNGDIQGP
jgi:hypothetical protein